MKVICYGLSHTHVVPSLSQHCNKDNKGILPLVSSTMVAKHCFAGVFLSSKYFMYNGCNAPHENEVDSFPGLSLEFWFVFWDFGLYPPGLYKNLNGGVEVVMPSPFETHLKRIDGIGRYSSFEQLLAPVILSPELQVLFFHLAVV